MEEVRSRDERWMQQQMEQMHRMRNAWRNEQQAQQKQDVEEERLYQGREEMRRDARLEQITNNTSRQAIAAYQAQRDNNDDDDFYADLAPAPALASPSPSPSPSPPPPCYDFRRLRQSSTVIVSKVRSQMSPEECKSWTCIVLLGLRAKVQVKGLSIKDQLKNSLQVCPLYILHQCGSAMSMTML